LVEVMVVEAVELVSGDQQIHDQRFPLLVGTLAVASFRHSYLLVVVNNLRIPVIRLLVVRGLLILSSILRELVHRDKVGRCLRSS
jgi:hypothetical protein